MLYEIWSGSTLVGVTGDVTYIRLHSNGCYALCEEAEAQGIAVGGTPYNLDGREAMPGLETVSLSEAEYVTFGQLAAAMREGVNGIDGQ